MLNEYEHLFNEFANPVRKAHFTEPKDGKDQNKVYGRRNKIVCHVETRSSTVSNRVLGYSIKMTKEDIPFLLLTYTADCPPFKPESVRYYEPTWLDFTDEQLAKAIKYLSPLLKMKMKPDRSHYTMLVFKTHFYLAIRTKNEINTDLEHCLCIKAYDVCLDNLKL